MVSRLKFHYWNVVVVLALVLCETLVESQYYLEDEVPAESRPLYLYNSDLVARAQPFLPTEEEGRAFSGRSSAQNGEEENPGRMFAARRGRVESEEEDEDDDEDERPPRRPSQMSVTHQPGRSRPVHLPPGFDDKVRKRMRYNKKTRRPLHGDPDPIDDEDEEGRKPESRLLWPFSIEITKGDKNKGWGGGPGGHGSYGPPPHAPPRTGLGVGLGVNNHKLGFDVKHDVPVKQYGRIGFTKGRLPYQERHGSFHVSSGYGPQNGWGWDAFIEHEKHRLKYEILKLKAKKKIAVLQNKVELKKLFSMLLQKKIQALEWW